MSELQLTILGFVMIYALIHGMVISFRKFDELTGYQKVIVCTSTLIIVLLMVSTMDL